MFLVAITLLFTVSAALIFGIFAGYWVLNAVFFAFHRRAQQPAPSARVLAPTTQTGD